MLSTLLIILSFAHSEQAPAFKTLHLTGQGYYLNESKSMSELKCNAYVNKKEEGIKYRFTVQDKEFAIECKGSEVGIEYNLVVTQKSKLLSKIEGIVRSGGDCGMRFETQAWLLDLNSDGHMDVIQRSKFHDGPSDCGGQKEVEDEDSVIVHQWNASSQNFQKISLDKAKIQQYKKLYNFKF